MTLRVGFAGTPEFSRQALRAILDAGFVVPLVLTQPDRPSGRGLKLTPSAVKQLALEVGLPIAQPRSLRLDGKYPEDATLAGNTLKEAALDVLVVAAYGLILPSWALKTPRYGCLNIHASLLPRWRGAAPIQRAIEAGDTHTGVTIMQMDEGLDTGDMLLEERVAITDADTAASLHDKLAQIGASLIVASLKQLASGRLTPRPQPKDGVTYAAKLDKTEAAIDLHLDAQTLARRIRAFNPVPGATLRLPGIDAPVKVWLAQAVEPTSVTGIQTPNTVSNGSEPAQARVLSASAHGIDIDTGHGTLRLLELQRAGGNRQTAAAFISGWSWAHAT
jgi:methionyl-tRNA formyltransferase